MPLLRETKPMSIVTMRANLTDSDIRTLIKGPTEDERAHAAHKICRCIEEGELSPEERAHAEGIIAIMAQDAAVLVRRALAMALKNSPKLPREIANKLARDVEIDRAAGDPEFADPDRCRSGGDRSRLSAEKTGRGCEP